MKSFNWIHLTDLHFGLVGQPALWPNIRKSFWDDLEKLHQMTGPWDAVFFTGDLVQTGSKDEFTALEDKVLGPLWTHLANIGTKNPPLLSVPGNHDLARPDAKKPKAALRILQDADKFTSIADEFWSDPGSEYRDIITSAFANYKAWFQTNPRTTGVSLNQGILPGDFAASISIPSASGECLKIGVAGLNTTFLQLGKGDYRKRLAVDSRQLHEACGSDLPAWVQSHDACILLTHQGPDWLNTNATEAYGEINPAGRFAVHLFGHMHENAFRATSNGGGPIVRIWQGNSLFGLEQFGEPPQTTRRHGYAAGRIEFDHDRTTIRFWPRVATKDTNGWRFKPDHDSCVLVEGNSCTAPEHLLNHARIPRAAGGCSSETTVPYGKYIQEVKLQLDHALKAFKGQPIVFVEPKLSKTREFSEDSNELHALMKDPRDTLIMAPPEFGLTCLGLHLQLEAFKNGQLWLYINSDHTKGRKISDYIDERLMHYNGALPALQCIVLDSWDARNLDHLNMVNNITAKCGTVPIVLLAEDASVVDHTGNLSKLKRNIHYLHLQALSRASMRQLVAGYNASRHIGTEDVVLSGLAEHLESINVHRTPLNCYTLLRVLDSGYSDKLINKTKLLKALLFLLFTDSDSFTFTSNKPQVEECTFVLACFCKDLLLQGTRSFDAASFPSKLSDICKTRFIALNVEAMLGVLFDNNILLRRGAQIEFRHKYWILYFAAEWMLHDEEFKRLILTNRTYVKYPEIIEFYSGIDGKRSDAVQALLTDLTSLTDQVEQKIGISRSFDPLSALRWNPSNEYIQKARTQIAENVESSNLPAEIKDKHADRQYQSAAPYDQSISLFLDEYSVSNLLKCIKAASTALRSNQFVDVGLQLELARAIFRGWKEISRVAFWLSPILAKEGRATHDGFSIMLAEGFSDDINQRFNQIITLNPFNIVKILGGDLASKKICPLISECFEVTNTNITKHMMALFIVTVRPIGWYDATLHYINILHPRSFYLGDLFTSLAHELKLGDLEPDDEPAMKQLTRAILSKREYAPKTATDKEIPTDKLFSDENKMPIDKLLKGNRQNWPKV